MGNFLLADKQLSVTRSLAIAIVFYACYNSRKNRLRTWILELFLVNMSSLKPVISLNQIEQRLGVSLLTMAQFCQRWQITELALFGSVLRDDFNPNSDLDFLVTFSPDTKIGLAEVDQIEKELKNMVKRKIDLIWKKSIETSQNWIRRRNILETAKVIYGEG